MTWSSCMQSMCSVQLCPALFSMFHPTCQHPSPPLPPPAFFTSHSLYPPPLHPPPLHPSPALLWDLPLPLSSPLDAHLSRITLFLYLLLPPPLIDHSFLLSFLPPTPPHSLSLSLLSLHLPSLPSLSSLRPTDYQSLRIGGLTIAGILFVLGIFIILSEYPVAHPISSLASANFALLQPQVWARLAAPPRHAHPSTSHAHAATNHAPVISNRAPAIP